jgi:hypothetical protein
MKRTILFCLLAMSTALAVAQEGRRGTDLLIGPETERDARNWTRRARGSTRRRAKSRSCPPSSA